MDRISYDYFGERVLKEFNRYISSLRNFEYNDKFYNKIITKLNNDKLNLNKPMIYKFIYCLMNLPADKSIKDEDFIKFMREVGSMKTEEKIATRGFLPSVQLLLLNEKNDRFFKLWFNFFKDDIISIIKYAGFPINSHFENNFVGTYEKWKKIKFLIDNNVIIGFSHLSIFLNLYEFSKEDEQLIKKDLFKVFDKMMENFKKNFPYVHNYSDDCRHFLGMILCGRNCTYYNRRLSSNNFFEEYFDYLNRKILTSELVGYSTNIICIDQDEDEIDSTLFLFQNSSKVHYLNRISRKIMNLLVKFGYNINKRNYLNVLFSMSIPNYSKQYFITERSFFKSVSTNINPFHTYSYDYYVDFYFTRDIFLYFYEKEKERGNLSKLIVYFSFLFDLHDIYKQKILPEILEILKNSKKSQKYKLVDSLINGSAIYSNYIFLTNLIDQKIISKNEMMKIINKNYKKCDYLFWKSGESLVHNLPGSGRDFLIPDVRLSLLDALKEYIHAKLKNQHTRSINILTEKEWDNVQRRLGKSKFKQTSRRNISI